MVLERGKAFGETYLEFPGFLPARLLGSGRMTTGSARQLPDRFTLGDDPSHGAGGVGAEAHLGDVKKRVQDRADQVVHGDRVVGGLAAVGRRSADDLAHRQAAAGQDERPQVPQ